MKKRLLLIIFVFLGIQANELRAQDANSFYFMRGVPQSYQVNPALQPEFNFFLGLPGLSPLKFNFKTSLGLSDILQEDVGRQLWMTPWDEFANPQIFLDNLSEFNNITTEFSTSLASIGFRSGDSYITFDIREKAFIDIGFADDFMRMSFDWFLDQTYDLELDLTMNLYNEWSMGVSRKFGDRLTLGWRGKLLFGQANIHTPDFNIGLITQRDVWDVSTDITVRASAPYLLDYVSDLVQVPFDSAFREFENFDPDPPTAKEIQEMALNFSNFGLGMDVGADFRLFDWLQISASVVDFGSIKWNDMLSVENSASYRFEGVDVGNFDEGFEEEFLDSLEATFNNVSTLKGSYRSYIPTKVYIGGAVFPHPRYSFGLLSRTDIYNGRMKQQFTASINLYPINMISTTLSYSLLQGKYSSYGVGLALRAFPFNMYLLADFGPSLELYTIEDVPLGLPLDFRNINLKIGMNIMVGGPKRKSKAPVYDLPLID